MIPSYFFFAKMQRDILVLFVLSVATYTSSFYGKSSTSSMKVNQLLVVTFGLLPKSGFSRCITARVGLENFFCFTVNPDSPDPFPQ